MIPQEGKTKENHGVNERERERGTGPFLLFYTVLFDICVDVTKRRKDAGGGGGGGDLVRGRLNK